MMKKIISWLLVAIWLIVIFYFSNMDSMESNAKSKKTISFFAWEMINISSKVGNGDNSENVIDKSTSEETISNIADSVNLPFRKCMHVMEYLILSLLLLNALKVSNINKIYIMTLLLCLTFSLLDELHQLFVIGRTSRIIDVAIDSIGSLIGISIYYLKYCPRSNYGRLLHLR